MKTLKEFFGSFGENIPSKLEKLAMKDERKILVGEYAITYSNSIIPMNPLILCPYTEIEADIISSNKKRVGTFKFALTIGGAILLEYNGKKL
jgi:hypothetical protein